MLVYRFKALEVVAEVMPIAKAWQLRFQGHHERTSKDDTSPVTAVDFAVQAIIGQRLRSRFNIPILGEETAGFLERADQIALLARVTLLVREVIPAATAADICTWIGDRPTDLTGLYWCLDPIDGTRGFETDGSFAIVLALAQDQSMCYVVIGCPYLQSSGEIKAEGAGTIFAASETSAAMSDAAMFRPGDTADWWRIHVSPKADLSGLRIMRPRANQHTDIGRFAPILARLGEGTQILAYDSALKYCMVAAGFADAYIRFPLPKQPTFQGALWDMAAGIFLVRAAGGRVTDLAGNDYPLIGKDYAMPSVSALIATNGRIHEGLLKEVISD